MALSHENLLANIAQVRSHIDLYDSDVLFNPLPVFHCFGLTVGMLLPLIAGVKVVCHPTPLQPREIVRFKWCGMVDHFTFVISGSSIFIVSLK